MTEQTATQVRIFSINEANTCLPLVKVIVRDVVEMSTSILECRERLDFLRLGREDLQGDMYEDELNHMEDSLEGDAATLNRYLAELDELGVETRSLTDGQVEFPAMIGGQLIYLCWQYGEELVDYWREVDEDFSQRKLIDLMFEDVGGMD